MKKQAKSLFSLSLCVLGLLFLSSSLFSQQTAGELFEKALYLEEAQGDLQKAIGMYEKILAQYPGDREVAAKAQLHIGLCYEKLGQVEAQKAFQKVVENYPDQSAAVKVAREKLAALTRARALIEKGKDELTIRQVWTGPGADIMGAVSPDGRFLSFTDWDTGDLAIRELATGKNRRLTNKGSWMQSQEFALFSKWSPDGRHVVYQWYNKDRFFELSVIDIDQPKPRVLRNNKEEYVHPFDWSPDGRQILALIGKMDVNTDSLGDRPNDTFQLALISAEDGAVHNLKSLVVGVNKVPFSFTFSPDGKFIAYDSPQEGSLNNRDIFLLSADGTQAVPLVEHPALDYVLGWTPDGKSLLFASERTGSRSAWLIPVVDGKPQGLPEMIKRDIGSILALGFTPQGAFFYGISRNISDVYVTKLDPARGIILDPAKKVALPYEGQNGFPAYSPDGTVLAYVSMRSSRSTMGGSSADVLCLLSLKTSKIRELVPDLPGFGYPRWSPDGRFISLEGQGKDGRPGLFRLDIQTGDAIPLVQFDPGTKIFSHRWAKDGKSIIYARGGRPTEPSSVYALDIETGQEKQLLGSPSDAKDIDISPDGKWLVLINRDKKRTIKIMSASGGDARQIFSFEEEFGQEIITPAWSADGRHILFSKPRSSAAESNPIMDLYSISAEGGEAQKIDVSMNEFRHLSVHPDGQHLAFSSRGSGSGYSEVWVMENFLPSARADGKEKKQ